MLTVASNTIFDHRAGLTQKRESKTDATFRTTCFMEHSDESTVVAGLATHKKARSHIIYLASPSL